MLFNSLGFCFLFLPLTFLGFYWVMARTRVAVAISYLGAASLLFYGLWDYHYIGILVGSILFNYACGVLINSGRFGPIRIRRKKTAFLLGVTVDLLVLAYYKYADFAISTANGLLDLGILPLNVTLPLGISFFTFTQIAFLADAYRHSTAEYKFANYFLFVTYFPHLIAGPILHHSEMMPQFEHVMRRRHLHSQEIALGLSMFAIGLAKKVLIADRLSSTATMIFGLAAQSDLSLIEAWTGALMYTLQLYFDFSGYCDMAIGISLMFGIKLPLNFNSPYKSASIIDFWRRWHMTLSRFLRDYIYIPLGGNRKGAFRRHANLMTTMLLGGLWHGASWTFVAWGGLHGMFLVVNHLWQTLPLAKHLSCLPSWRRFSQTLTFLCVVIAWVFFRAENFDAAFRMLAAMFGGGKGLIIPSALAGFVQEGLKLFGDAPVAITYGSVKGAPSALWVPVFLALTLWFPNSQEMLGARNVALGEAGGQADASVATIWRWRATSAWAVVCGLLAVASILSFHRASEFLYYQF